ncbi:small, acid-soluble spore protein, alpha/beta type [Paenibacillus septentrionalis]|uniref:Small, acid-soluble spore protein, alpha/beta type n=1 Tax=Paenibacillus septentrionalis TaxID=429342 RepID=A0ABW1VA30_9BACL
MGRRRRVMSEQLKVEIARELGLMETIEKEGWGAIKAKDAGNIVKRAIQMAEEAAARGIKQ